MPRRRGEALELSANDAEFGFGDRSTRSSASWTVGPTCSPGRRGRFADDVTPAGNVVAHLYAATPGSDADWAVKLIDVYPDTVHRPTMGGYELMVTGDIMRGRYRTSWEHPAPLRPNAVEPHTADVHQQAHTFKKGHRIMVQQSTCVPLYDRNPHTFVPNIFKARPADYRARTHRVYRTMQVPLARGDRCRETAELRFATCRQRSSLSEARFAFRSAKNPHSA